MYKIKNQFGEKYDIHESFVMRNPLFPVEVFFNWKSLPDLNLVSSKEFLTRSLREFYLQPVAQEALYIGSPDLHEQLLLWLEDKIEKKDKREKTELSLVKYMIRMCTRCTPYGLFASCTSVNISESTNILLSDKDFLERHGRLDMDYVCEALSFLLTQKEISKQLHFYLNTSLYSLGKQWRYIEHRFNKEAGRTYHLVQVDKSVYLEKIFHAVENGCTPGELAVAITNDEISSEEATEFIYELINNQVLVSELEPNVTGEDYFSVLLSKLKSLKYTEKIVRQLEKASGEFEQIKKPGHNDRSEFYQKILQHLKQLKIPLHFKTLIQVDSYRPATKYTLNKKVGDEIVKGMSLLNLIITDHSVKDFFLDFKDAFKSRYEGQWIPLVEVLDTESGIGYGKFATSGMEESPLIDKLPIGNGQVTRSTRQSSVTEEFKWKIYQEAITHGRNEIIIEDKTLEMLSAKEISQQGIPDSVYTMLKLNAHSANEIDKGNYTLSIQSPWGPSGANLLGRFCHLNPEIEKLTRAILRNEEGHHSDCIYAEIVHLPKSRTGNILMRPVLREYEIPYLCGSTLSKEFQIQVTDLIIGIEANRVVLRSQRLNKEIIPRMTSAHNFSMTSLPVYQFLCDLQYQQIRYMGWQWGILDSRPFLPRVSCGKFILSKARWLLTKQDISDCYKKIDEEIVVIFSTVAKQKKLPEYVLLSQGDNELLLHLKNIFCIKLLLNEVKKSETVILTESLDVPEQCWIKSPDGHHIGEFIFSLSRKKSEVVHAKANFLYERKITSVKRYFPVGSEWLYAKIYCGTKTAEKILCEVVNPLTKELLAEKIIDKYFFLRYHDESHHLRIRFHSSSNENFWQELIKRLQTLLQSNINDHLVNNVQFETYQREVERYGYDTVEMSEDIFFYQSVAVLNFISMLNGDAGEQYRWQIALKAVDLFLDDFHYSLEQKMYFAKIQNQAYGAEFTVGPAEQKKISERFSGSKELIHLLMSDGWEDHENLKKGIGIFKIENQGYRKSIEEILSSRSVNYKICELNSLMSSYLHMFFNRMFVGNQKKVELVIYNYLSKYYESRIAREKNKKSKPMEAVIKAL